MSRQRTIERTSLNGSIKLTAYLSSGRISVEVLAQNPVMDWWELEDFLDEIKAPNGND